MFTKSRGITVAKYTYDLVLIARLKKEKTSMGKSHNIISEVEHELQRDLDFFIAVVEGIEAVYEHLEGNKYKEGIINLTPETKAWLNSK